MEERTPAKWKTSTGTKDLEANKLTREPSSSSWVMVQVERGQETRLPRVGREHKSSPRYPPSNSTLSRSHGISHMPRQPHTPVGDREPRGSGRQAVPPGWAVQSKLASGDPSNPVPQYNLKMAKSVGDLRGDKSASSPLSQGRSRFGPVPPLPSTPSLGNGNPSPSRDATPISQTVNGDSAGSSSQRDVILSPNDPPKPQAEPSRPLLRTSPTNSRPVRPLPQQTPVQPVPDVTVTAAQSQPRLPFPQSPPSGLSTPTSSTSTFLPAQSDTISRPRSVLDEESIPPPAPPPHTPRLQRPVDSSVFSEPLRESDMLRSPLPLAQAPRFPPRQLPPPISRDDSAPVTAARALPIPGRQPAMDDRSADAKSGCLIDITSSANRTPPRSPVSPRSPWTDTRERFGPRTDVAATNATSPADVRWCHGQGRDLIDFNRPAEQTIMQDDSTLRAIEHLLDGQSSDEATMTMKPKSFVLPHIPPPPPLRPIGYVPPPPPLPKPPTAPIPVTPTQSNSSIYSSTPLTPESQPSDQDGSDSEAGTLWQKPMIEEAERPKSASRGPPLTVKIDQFGGSPVHTSQMKSTGSSGGTTLIPINFPPPPKHPPPSPPLPHWGGRTPTTRQLQREQSKSEGTFQDSSWASRPNPEEVLDRLEVFFPDHDLDKPVIEASSGGTSPTAAENPPAPLPYNGKPPPDKRSRHKKSIRVVAEEHNLRQDRTSRLQSSSAANVFRKRSTKLWDSRVEEVTPGQITLGMPPIPDSPSATGPGTPAPKRPFLLTLAFACVVAHISSLQPSSNGFGVSSLGRAISVASTWR